MRSYLKNYRTELSRQKGAKEPYYPKAVSLIRLVLLSQADESGFIQLEQSLLFRRLRFVARVRNACSYLLHLHFKDREFWSFGGCQGTITQVGEVYSGVNWTTGFNIQFGYSFRRVQAFRRYIDWSTALESLTTPIGPTDTQFLFNTLFSSLLTDRFPTA